MTVTRTSEAMSIIEEIRADVNARWGRNEISDESHRRKIAWLERLEEPTQRMRRAGMQAALHAQGSTPDGIWMHVCRDVIAAAEEDLP